MIQWLGRTTPFETAPMVAAAGVPSRAALVADDVGADKTKRQFNHS